MGSITLSIAFLWLQELRRKHPRAVLPKSLFARQKVTICPIASSKNEEKYFEAKNEKKCLETTWEPSTVLVEVSSHGIRVTMSKVRMHKLHIYEN